MSKGSKDKRPSEGAFPELSVDEFNSWAAVPRDRHRVVRLSEKRSPRLLSDFKELKRYKKKAVSKNGNSPLF